MASLIEIKKNADTFCKKDINGNSVTKIRLIIFKSVPIIASIILVFMSKDNFDFEAKTIGALLSLFTGILFGQLLKISDKVREIPVKSKNLSESRNIKRIQEINYLKSFFYFLSYSILVSLIIIILLIIQSFIPILVKEKLSNYSVSDINLESFFLFIKLFFICSYRFILILHIFRFIQYIGLSIIYIYEYIKFDFMNKEKF